MSRGDGRNTVDHRAAVVLSLELFWFSIGLASRPSRWAVTMGFEFQAVVRLESLRIVDCEVKSLGISLCDSFDRMDCKW